MKTKAEDDLVREDIPLTYLDLFQTIMSGKYTNVFFKDKESRFIYVSNEQMHGFNCTSPEQVLGKTDFDFFSEEHATEAMRDEKRIMETGEPLLNKIEKLLWATGETSWVQVFKYPLYDREGNIVGTWGISQNVTNITNEKRQLEEVNMRLEDEGNYYKQQCITDDMTELYNRRKFYEELNLAFDDIRRKRKSDEFCITFIDIDNFKAINDQFGHQFGDFLIRETASIIRANIREDDIAFRYGGDEFLILYKQTGKKEAQQITNRIRLSVGRKYFSRAGIGVSVTISGGVASSTEADEEDELIQLADVRLYVAKEAGKDRIA